MRVHEIARTASTDSKTVLSYLRETLGTTVKSPSSAVPPIFGQLAAEKIRERIEEQEYDDAGPCCIAYVTSRSQDHVPGCNG